MSEPTGSSTTVDDMEDPTPFDDVDVDDEVATVGLAPEGEELTEDESVEIGNQVTAINLSNQTRAPDEQISLDPAEVN